MSKFWNWIKDNKSGLVVFTVSVLFFITYQQCSVNKKLIQDLETTQNIAQRNLENLKAIQDSIVIERNTNNEAVSRIRSLIFNQKNLDDKTKKILQEYEKVLNVNTELEQINSAISGQLKIKDSLINTLTTVSVTADEIRLDFKGEKKWDENNIRIFSGDVVLGVQPDSIFIKTADFNIVQAISLKAAIVSQGNVNMLKISTPNPDITFTTIENINIVNDFLNKPPAEQPKILDENYWQIGFGLITQVRSNNKDDFYTVPAFGINATRSIAKNQLEFNFSMNNEFGYLDNKLFFSPAITAGLFWKPKWLKF
jgi:hypothetical protein